MRFGPGVSAAGCSRGIQDFAAKAGPILDLYEGVWDGKPLAPEDCVVSADEKTSIQARKRRHPTQPPGPGELMRVEHEYERKGAWAYLAAWDVRNARIHGRCERKTGIAPFRRLVRQVMSQEPYRSAPRVDRRQRLLASRTGVYRPFDQSLAQHRRRPHPRSRQLAQSDRDLLLDRAAQGAHPPTTSTRCLGFGSAC